MKALVALAALLTSGAAQAETARAFVERIYAGYQRENFNPLERPADYFAPPLAVEIGADSAGEDVGYLDGDPLCDCQDVSGLKPRIASVRVHGRTAADARILLDFRTSDARAVTLHLVLTNSGWRVADVSTKEEPSLLNALRRSNHRP